MFQSYADIIVVGLFAAFVAVAFAVVAAGAKEQSRRRRPGDPIPVESHRAAYYEWMARHDRRRRNVD